MEEYYETKAGTLHKFIIHVNYNDFSTKITFLDSFENGAQPGCQTARQGNGAAIGGEMLIRRKEMNKKNAYVILHFDYILFALSGTSLWYFFRI